MIVEAVDRLIRVEPKSFALTMPEGVNLPLTWKEEIGPATWIFESRPLLPWVRKRRVALRYSRRPKWAEEHHVIGRMFFAPKYLRKEMKGYWVTISGPHFECELQ